MHFVCSCAYEDNMMQPPHCNPVEHLEVLTKINDGMYFETSAFKLTNKHILSAEYLLRMLGWKIVS